MWKSRVWGYKVREVNLSILNYAASAWMAEGFDAQLKKRTDALDLLDV
jgi:hypothetical protein